MANVKSHKETKIYLAKGESGLIKAMDEFKLKEGLEITEDLDKEVEVDDKKIVYEPLWKWLLR